jgi:hypothetical protein
MRRRMLLCLTLTALSACNGDRAGQPVATSATTPSKDISDAVHSINDVAGNPDFFLLPPMVKNPSGSPQWDAGAFNAKLHPTVEICASVAKSEAEVLSAACTPLSALSASVDEGAEQYQASWKVPSSSTIFYRISVKVGAIRLGFADVETASNTSQLKNVTTSDFIPLVDGRTLPIKFRVERYALCDVPGKGPCTSTTVNLATGGTALDEAGTSGVTIPAQGPGAPEVTITVADCASFNPRVTDLPTFGTCKRITATPALTARLTNRATVFNCTVNVRGVVAEGLTAEQAERITLHQLDEDDKGAVLRAVPHTEACGQTASTTGSGRDLFADLSHGRIGSAARQALHALSPTPLYARFIDLGGGGLVEEFSDFQFALPAKLEIVSGDGQVAAPGTLLPEMPTVKVTDLDGRPVQGARVTFATTDGAIRPIAASAACPLRNNCAVAITEKDGTARIAWTISTTAGANSLRALGRGLAGTNANGPRADEVDPFQPIQKLHSSAPTDTAVVVGTGSVTFTATGRSLTNAIDGGELGALKGALLQGVTLANAAEGARNAATSARY